MPADAGTALLLAVILLSARGASARRCADPWPDVCPGAPQGCSPYVPLAPGAANLTALRGALADALFAYGGGRVTNKTEPDFVVPVADSSALATRGCWCSTLGNCDAAACRWQNNLTQLVFGVELPLANGTVIHLNSTAFWSLNTSGVAPSTYIGELGPPAFPEVPFPALGLSDTVVVWHNGHNSPCEIPGGDPDYDGTIDFLNQAGFDTIALHMPMYQVNSGSGGLPPCAHEYFGVLALEGAPVFRAFIEPIVRAVSFAVARGYKKIALAGLSGGGWSTTIGAAVDARIGLSVPVAGSLPCDFAEESVDWEQSCDQPWLVPQSLTPPPSTLAPNPAFQSCTHPPPLPHRARVANYSTLYALAALEPGRAQVQVLHEQDSCCFHGCGRHDRIRAYGDTVRGAVAGGGAFGTVVTRGNIHEVNLRDRVVLATALDEFRRSGAVEQAAINALPFNTLQEW